jgi:hypothetical protein
MVVSYIPPTPGDNQNGSYTKTKSYLAGYRVVSLGSCAYIPAGRSLLVGASMGDWIVSLGSCGYGPEGLTAIMFLVLELGGTTLGFCLSHGARVMLVFCLCP